MHSFYLIAFDSTQQAIRTEMLLEYADIDIDTLPTPKQVTAGCALSIAFPQQDLAQVVTILVEERVEIRGLFEPIADDFVEMKWEEMA
jgi:hypothetical protein